MNSRISEAKVGKQICEVGVQSYRHSEADSSDYTSGEEEDAEGDPTLNSNPLGDKWGNVSPHLLPPQFF